MDSELQRAWELLIRKCCICLTPVENGGLISTGDIKNPTYRFCCDWCFRNMVCS